MRVEPLTASIGAELHGVEPRPTPCTTTAVRRDPRAAAEAQGAVPARPALQPLRARRLRAALRRAGGPPGGRQRPRAPGPGADLQDARQPPRPVRERLALRRHLAREPAVGRVLRCVECPPVGGDMIWANMALAYERLPEHIKTQIAGLRARHSIEASFGAAMPIEKRLALQRPVSPTPSTRSCARIPETGEKVLFVNAFTTHFTQLPHARQRALRPGLRPGRSQSAADT